MAKKVANLSVVGRESARDDIDEMLDMAGVTVSEEDQDDVLEEFSEHLAGEQGDETSADDGQNPGGFGPSFYEKQIIERMNPRKSDLLDRQEILGRLDVVPGFKGAPDTFRSSQFNISLILMNDPRTRGAFSMDLFSGRTMLLKKIKFDTTFVSNIYCRPEGQRFTDDHASLLMTWLGAPLSEGGYGLNASSSALAGAIMNAAYQNPSHKIYEFITSKPWDGVKRLDTFYSRHLNLDTKNRVYNEAVSRTFTVATITRVIEEGHKVDSFPVLQEPEGGAGKSEFIEVLALGHNGTVSESREISDGRNLREATAGKLIIELPELSAFIGLDSNVVRAKMTIKCDTGRAAYARYEEDTPRAFVFMGTKNPGEYLKDPDRRYWPIRVRRSAADPIDLKAVRDELQQVYAEALAVYREMRHNQPHGTLPLFLTGEAAEIADRLRHVATEDTPAHAAAGWLSEWLSTPAITKFAGIEVGGRTYRDRFCLKEAFEAYSSNGGMETPQRYGTPETKMMSEAVRMLRFVTKGQVSRFEKHGSQVSYFVDPAWVAAQVGADSEPEPETSARPENVISIAASKPVSLFEDWNAAEADFAQVDPIEARHQAELEADSADAEASVTPDQKAAADAAIEAVHAKISRMTRADAEVDAAQAEWDAIEAEMAADASKT